MPEEAYRYGLLGLRLRERGHRGEHQGKKQNAACCRYEDAFRYHQLLSRTISYLRTALPWVMEHNLCFIRMEHISNIK